MRVAIDVSLQSHRRPTGVERTQATLLAGLAEAEHEHELVLLSPEELPARLADRVDDPRVRPIAWPGSVPRRLWRQVVVPGLLKDLEVDLFHSPVAAFPLRAPCPVVATVHEVPWVPDVGDRRASHRAWLWAAARRATRIVVPSERTRAHLVRLEPDVAGRTRVVPAAVDPVFLAENGAATARRLAAVADLGTASFMHRPFVLAVGALRDKKNLARLVDAFVALPEAVRGDHRLVLVGPAGDAAEELRAKIAAEGLEDRVVLAGHVPDETLVAVYGRASCLVHPSLLEGFGLPPLEAMACGTPVVASREGAVGELIEGAAELFDPHDVDDLARALHRVLSDTRRAVALVARGRKRAARFDRGRAVGAVLDVWAECSGAALAAIGLEGP